MVINDAIEKALIFYRAGGISAALMGVRMVVTVECVGFDSALATVRG